MLALCLPDSFPNSIGVPERAKPASKFFMLTTTTRMIFFFNINDFCTFSYRTKFSSRTETGGRRGQEEEREGRGIMNLSKISTISCKGIV